MTSQPSQSTGFRRWLHRWVGHQFISPVTGTPIHCYIPSIESFGPRLIGRCKCGEEWWTL